MKHEKLTDNCQYWHVYSDGGSSQDGVAGSAAIVVTPFQTKIKIVAFLGKASDAESELFAGLIGFAALNKLSPLATTFATWTCDDMPLLSSATKLLVSWQQNNWLKENNYPTKNTGLWHAFLSLTCNMRINCEYVKAHSGHQRNEACDRACRWMQTSGSKLIQRQGEGLIGSVRHFSPKHAWLFLDARQYIELLRDKSPSERDILKLQNKITEMLMFSTAIL